MWLFKVTLQLEDFSWIWDLAYEKKILPHAERMENKEPESAKAPAQHWEQTGEDFKSE